MSTVAAAGPACSSAPWPAPGIMIAGGLVELFLGINAEGKSLEEVTQLLTATRTEPLAAQPVPTPA